MARLQPALLGGLFIGVLSSLPIVGAANLCCCLWVVAGGLITVYLRRQSPLPPGGSEAFEAVLGGVVAGIVGAAIGFLLGAVLGGYPTAVEMQQTLEQLPQVPPEIRERLVRIVAERGPMFFAVLSFLLTVPIYAIFSVLGALLGLAIFKKPVTPPPPPPPPVPPASLT